MSEQLDMVYDWMIKHGKRLVHRRVNIRYEIVYNASFIANIHEALSNKRGSIKSFCEYLIENGVFTNQARARQALRLYSTNIGDAQSDHKRRAIVALFKEWNERVPLRGAMNYYNKKLAEYWEMAV